MVNNDENARNVCVMIIAREMDMLSNKINGLSVMSGNERRVPYT